jgi:predicted dehydrogenase
VADKVRLASVGLGNWAGVLARAVSRGSVAEVVSCWSRSAESIARFQHEHGVDRAAGSLDELLSDPEVEGVLVTTPNDAHMPVVVAALEAGKAVYTDKPIAHSMADAVRIKSAAERTRRVFSIGHSARRMSGHRTMKDWVESGRTGGISMVEAHFTTRTDST